MEYINKKHEQQINYLKSIINKGTYSQQFRVIGLETSTGKTVSTCLTLAEASARPTLLVVKFNEEQINDMTRINNICKNNKRALALTSQNFKQYKNKLLNYPILIISHKRYLMACQGKEVKINQEQTCPLWNLLIQYNNGLRENLIIDECPNWIESWTYSTSIRQKFAGKLTPKIEEEFQDFNKKYISNIFEKYYNEAQELKEQKKKDITHIRIYNFNKLIAQQQAIQQLNNINEKIQNEISDDWRIEKRMSKNSVFKICPYETFLDKLKILIQSEEVIMNLSGTNNTIPKATHGIFTYPKLLFNNILLDANAKTDECYKLNSIFNINNNSNIINYSKSKFIVTEKNCSTQTIQSDRHYIDTVVDKIQCDITNNDKILIIASNKIENSIKNKIVEYELNYKDEEEITDLFENNKIIKEKALITTNHFQNCIGKNIYKDFNKAYSIASPKLPQENYILMYRYHTGKKLNNKYNYNLRKSKINGNLYFYNGVIDKIANTNEANEIMQCLKRISRNKEGSGEYYLIHNNQDIIDLVTTYFQDIKIINSNWFNDYKNELIEKDKLKNNSSQWASLINFFESMKIDKEYKKKDIGAELHISKLNRILNHKKVKEYIKQNKNININQYTIIKYNK